MKHMEDSKMIKKVMLFSITLTLHDVMVVNITFLSFLLFSMCHSIHVAVNTWLNCSFFLHFYNKASYKT